MKRMDSRKENIGIKEDSGKKKKSEGMEWVRSIFIAVIAALLIRHFVGGVTFVSGNSMNETLHDGDRIIVESISLKFSPLQRGDVVVIQRPEQEKVAGDKNTDFVKRVVGLPGDLVQIIGGDVHINGKKLDEYYINHDYTDTIGGVSEWYVADDEIFVLGDNRQPNASNDSRRFGPIKINTVRGVVVYRIYPFDRWGTIS